MKKKYSLHLQKILYDNYSCLQLFIHLIIDID